MGLPSSLPSDLRASGSQAFGPRAGVPSPCHQLPDTWGLWTQAYTLTPLLLQLAESRSWFFSVSINMQVNLSNKSFLCLSIYHLSIIYIIYPSIHQSYHFYLSTHHLYLSYHLSIIYLSIIYLYLYSLSVLFLWGPLTHTQ